MSQFGIIRDEFHREWNYTLGPDDQKDRAVKSDHPSGGSKQVAASKMIKPRPPPSLA
jgi:hypothetical protein